MTNFFKSLFLSLLLWGLMMGMGWATTYYVDTTAANDTDTGLIGHPWKTISKVNSTTFSPGDIIKFKDDQTWREQLTIPNTGTVGSNITWTRTGDGTNKPRISGGDLISVSSNGSEITDDFNGDCTGWTITGGGAVLCQNNKVEFTVATGAEQSAKLAGTARTEYWASFRIYLNTVTISDNAKFFVGGIQSGANARLLLGVVQLSGGLQWRLEWDTDSGAWAGSTNTGVVPATGQWYDGVLHWKASTGAGANNGILQAWVNGSSIYSATNADTDTLTANTVVVGNRYANGTITAATFYCDDAKLSTYQVGTNIYSASLTTEPKQVVFNGTTLGSVQASVIACDAANKWYWAGNRLYVYSASAPTSIEAAQRQTAITVNGKSYITIDGLQLDLSNNVWPNGGVYATGNLTNLTVQNCEIEWGGYGIYGYSGTTGSNLFYNNLVHHNAGIGVTTTSFSGGAGTENIIRGNQVYNNLQAGIVIRSNYHIVENNIIHDNGNSAERFNGLHIYTLNNSEGLGQHNILRYNIVYNQIGYHEDGNGIVIDQWCDYNDVYYNIVYGCESAGMISYDASHINLYNNTLYNNSTRGNYLITNFKLSAVTLTPTYVVVKNNISSSVHSNNYAIAADSAYSGATGVVISNNTWYAPNHATWYYWNGSAGSNLATWNALTEVGTDLNADPLFISSSDFHLQSTSPAINAGVDVGLTSDYEGKPIRGLPDIGAFEYQISKLVFRNHIFPGLSGTEIVLTYRVQLETGEIVLLETGDKLREE